MKKFTRGFILGTLTTLGAVAGSVAAFHKTVVKPIEEEENRFDENRRAATRKGRLLTSCNPLKIIKKAVASLQQPFLSSQRIWLSSSCRAILHSRPLRCRACGSLFWPRKSRPAYSAACRHHKDKPADLAAVRHTAA